jgi:hypothetical protein
MFNISRPTLPVAPTTATLYDMAVSSFDQKPAFARVREIITPCGHGGKEASRPISEESANAAQA